MKAHKRIVETRWEVIQYYVKDKDVLDVGCAELIGTTTNQKKISRWIHAKIAKIAKNTTGVDISKEQVKNLSEMGYNIIEGDAETFYLGKKYDVIVAGELIEHLSNPGLFLNNMRNHLKDNGFLILTTPNRFDLRIFLRSLRSNKIPSYNKPIAAHVMYFDENSIRALLERHGFEPINVVYYWTFSKDYDSRFIRFLLAPIIRFRPSFVRGLIVVSMVSK